MRPDEHQGEKDIADYPDNIGGAFGSLALFFYVPDVYHKPHPLVAAVRGLPRPPAPKLSP